MYALEVRDHVMIAHSLPDGFFGPAQNLHGSTFIVDVAFFRQSLDEHNVVVDIWRAAEALKTVLQPINYANLDALPAFTGKLTSTEFLCQHVFEGMQAAMRAGDLGPGGLTVERMRVTLSESHVARAWFEAPVNI